LIIRGVEVRQQHQSTEGLMDISFYWQQDAEQPTVSISTQKVWKCVCGMCGKQANRTLINTNNGAKLIMVVMEDLSCSVV